ncbi:MAG TPA: glycosyltransferase family 39 protein [Thermoanaerobaculia bacterium]|nr:glycosyltransferase family 39 protein [Thermoanaerobaculia bacterium]
MSFSTEPEPITARQRAIVICVALVCAATRFLALARSVWDWDEALFTMAMRDYAVTLHHPHPPGFPVFIAIGRVVRLVIGDDFRALQAVNLVAAMLVCPAIYLFARELRLRFETCVIAAALFAFFPNVWFFGGGAFSDVPSIVLVLFAVTFLLRGARDRKAYWFGTLLLALAIGIRPQNFLVGLIPGIYATRKRRPLEILVALLIGVVIVGAAYGGAIYATGDYDDYMRMVRGHGDYISRIDSWRSPDRPPLWRIFDRFFIKQYQSPALSIIASLFAMVSIVGAIRSRDRSMLWNALTFVPFAIVAWLMLDRFSISRFSIAYQPMFAIFVADGIHRVAGERRHWLAPALATALILGFVAYTLPALTAVRNEIAPSILAARAVAKQVDPSRERLYVGHTMTAFMDLVLPGFPYTKVLDDRAMPLTPPNQPSWLLAEITETAPQRFLFQRERGNLWNIARRHYFEIKLQPVTEQPRFLSGWYSPEGMGMEEWRWMRGHSVMLLPPANGRTLLHLDLGVPFEVMPKNPAITVKLNGRIVDRFNTTQNHLERDYRVIAAPNGLPNVLELSIEHTVVPADDGRQLGLRMRFLSWGPA